MQFDRPLDPRFGRNYISWKVFRRKQMENICKLENISIREGATHEEMEVMLSAKEVNPMKYSEIIFLGKLHDRGEDRARNLEHAVRALPVKTIIDDVDFQKMKMYELRQECNLQGIQWKKTDKKSELLARIKDKMYGNTAGRR